MIRFRMEWQDAPGVRDTVLARSWCRLVIEAGGRLVTEAAHDASNSLRGGDRGRNEYDRARCRRMKRRMPCGCIRSAVAHGLGTMYRKPRGGACHVAGVSRR